MFKHLIEKITISIAWMMPKYLVYWCAVRLFSYATSGEYSDQVAPELLAMEALDRWTK